MVAERVQIPRSLYAKVADRLSHAAERSAEVSIYISPDEIAEALGDRDYNPDASPFSELQGWIIERRRLGFEPTADDVLDWIEANRDDA